MDIKQMIEKDNYIIVLDTNVLLNVYRYSPEFSEFALNCLQVIKEHIVLPATVRLEYGKHYRPEFAKMQERVKNAGNDTSAQIKQAKMKILRTCDNLERLHFLDVEELRNSLSGKLDELQVVLDDFFVERSGLELISHSWDNVDYLFMLVDEWDRFNQILPALTQEDIYSWCEEGEKRYKNQVPPGFMDAKNKDGVRKYSDLLLWKEVLRFSEQTGKNIILVTDDLKSDWWDTINGNKQLHEKLLAEFSKTGHLLQPFISLDFYNEIANAYDVEKTDAVELALRMTDADYCISISEEVFEKIEGSIIYSNTDYIDVSSSHVGSEGIDELEITDHALISAERIDREDDIVTYHFKFEVTAEGTSYEYWGRDDDTKEVIRSYGTDHIFKGMIVVEVTREANIYLDFEDYNGFETARILSGTLEEVKYQEQWDESDEVEPGELGVCPICNCPLNFDNEAGGFCTNCAIDHD